jgi:hypothetical protein
MMGFVDWELQGPDENGHAWIMIDNSGFNLGPVDQALEKFGNFLAENDYEEREGSALDL